MDLSRAIVCASVSLVIAVGAGCTFGGLANYAIDACVPVATQAADVCERLNLDDPQSCKPFQCDAASRHCARKARDDDRDGDPAMSCGGTDCDDADPKRSGHAKEICDRVDNNCNGLVDEDVVKPTGERAIAPAALAIDADPAISATTENDLLAIYIASANACLPVVGLKPGSGSSQPCTLLKDEVLVLPRQPYARQLSSGVGAVFASTQGCPNGLLAYRYDANAAAKPALACPSAPGSGAARPSFAAMPKGANANSGVAVWYDGPVAERADPVGGCVSVKAAPLALAFLNDLTGPTLAPGAVIKTMETSAGTRPVSLVTIEEANGIVMTAPVGADVGVWLLTPAVGTAGALPPPYHVAGLATAHATALAARIDASTPGKAQLALVAEIGCHPAASIRLALGTLDPAGTFSFGTPIEVVGASDIATSPSVTWMADRSEWWVSWLDAGPHQRVRRFRADGTPIGGSIDAGKPFLVGAVSASGSVFGFDPTMGAGSFVEIPLGCGP